MLDATCPSGDLREVKVTRVTSRAAGGQSGPFAAIRRRLWTHARRYVGRAKSERERVGDLSHGQAQKAAAIAPGHMFNVTDHVLDKAFRVKDNGAARRS